MRLLPRFSLRFAWLALTIFLIVFAFGVNYYQRHQAHERVGQQFQTMNCNIEEEPIKLLGYTIGKRLTGIEITPQFFNAGSPDFDKVKQLEVLDQLPRPEELRRFGISAWGLDDKDLVRILTTLQRYPALEELYCNGVLFTDDLVQLVSRLPRLRVLDLSGCSLPRGSLSHLNDMPSLEKFSLYQMDCEMPEFLQLNLPKLRLVEMNECPLGRLELTKKAWGRFPNLETLILRNLVLQSVTAEPGALPRLKQLALYGETDSLGQLDWSSSPAALPELRLLAISSSYLEPELLAAAARFPQLESLYIDLKSQPTGSTTVMPLAQFSPAKLQQEAWREVYPALVKLIQQRPDFLYDADCQGVFELLNPMGLRNGPGMWSSPNWREKPKANNAGGGFF